MSCAPSRGTMLERGLLAPFGDSITREVSLIPIGFVLAGSLVSATPTGLEMDRCRANFTTRGSRLSGFTLKTFDDFPNITPHEAYQELEKAMSADGGVLQNVNERAGTISAIGALGSDVGSGHPVNGIVVPFRNGSRVELSWSVGGFIMFHKSDLELRFCNWLNRISRDTPK
jgi:hypothetical protein